jgi:pimeloyl-ACP methyl ester carboxylesterase
MSPTSERLALRPSVEARVQLDRVELLRVPAEPVCGCQRGLVQDGVPVVVAPSRRPDADVTHSSPIAAFYPPSHAGGGLPTSTSSSLPIDRPPVAASRPPENEHPAISASTQPAITVEQLGRITAPTLVVAGDDDMVTLDHTSTLPSDPELRAGRRAGDLALPRDGEAGFGESPRARLPREGSRADLQAAETRTSSANHEH